MRYQSILCAVAGLMPLTVITGLSLLDKDFTLFADYISDLGAGGYAVIFNASLVAAAALAVPFVLKMYSRYRHLTFLFLATAAALAGVGLFPSATPYHWHFSAAFFLLAFTTMLVAGLSTTSVKGRAVSVMLSLFGFAGLVVFQPLVETVLVFMIGGWVAGVGLLSRKLY